MLCSGAPGVRNVRGVSFTSVLRELAPRRSTKSGAASPPYAAKQWPRPPIGSRIGSLPRVQSIYPTTYPQVYPYGYPVQAPKRETIQTRGCARRDSPEEAGPTRARQGDSNRGWG